MMQDEKKGSHLVLRRTEPEDLETLFVYQRDEDAAYMAAFINENWKDKEFYLARWNKLLGDPTVNIRTVVLDDQVVGSVSTWQLMGELQISYWFGREYWNKGIATSALQQFLSLTTERPILGRVAFDNIGSANVLMKCGFRKVDEEKSYAYARDKEIVELVFLLEA